MLVKQVSGGARAMFYYGIAKKEERAGTTQLLPCVDA